MYQMAKSKPDNLILFSAGQAEIRTPGDDTVEIEDKVYSRAELRQMNLDTSEYRFLDEDGTFYATLFLKAEAREGMLRAFFDFEDGRKIITPIFWWQKRQGLWELPIGTRLRLHYAFSAKGGTYLTNAEVLKNLL